MVASGLLEQVEEPNLKLIGMKTSWCLWYPQAWATWLPHTGSKPFLLSSSGSRFSSTNHFQSPLISTSADLKLNFGEVLDNRSWRCESSKGHGSEGLKPCRHRFRDQVILLRIGRRVSSATQDRIFVAQASK